MRTKKQEENKEFDTVQTFRKIKEKVSKEMEGMNFEELKAYLKRESSKLYEEKN